MIVDTCTHLWQNLEQLGPQLSAQFRQRSQNPWDDFDAAPQAHEAAMGPVHAALVLGMRSVRLGARVPTDLVAGYVADSPHQLYGFAGIDPLERGALDQVESLPQMGISGVVLSPADQGFHPAHSLAVGVYERCQQLGLPVFIRQGTPWAPDAMMEYAQPALLDEVARAFPRLPIVLGGCGHPWVDQALVLIGKHDHVYGELSAVAGRRWPLYQLLAQAHHLGVTDRLLFGSGFPLQEPQQAVETIYSLNRISQGTGLPSLPRHKLRGIVERDALGLLGLSDQRRPASSPYPPATTPPAAEPMPSPAAQRQESG